MLTVFLIIAGNDSYCQKEADNWYFGNKAALNFSTCIPTVVSGSQMNTIEGCATISDVNGNLLFYTDGIKVWNRNNAVMPNGTGLYGHPSSTQSGVIVPQPGNDSIYYVFTVDVENGIRGLNYSIVNMKLNGGLGDVTVKNTNLLASANEKLTAVRHSNQVDIWVITRQFNSDKYYAWLVTAAGISVMPVISTSPNYLGTPFVISRGYLKPSTDGKRLLSAFDLFPFMEFSDFNNQTGAVTNIIKMKSQPKTIPSTGVAGGYGVEFSPDNRLLYITTYFEFSAPCPTCPIFSTYINQFNITNPDSTAIANSAVLIDSGGSVNNPAYDYYGALQLTKTGKIYIAQFDLNKLSVIDNPNAAGIACNFQKNAIDLGSGRSMAGLPTFIQSYFNPNYRTYDYSYTEDCNKILSFTLNTSFPYDSLRWDFGDPPSGVNNTSTLPNPTHTYNINSIRIVKLLVFNHYGCVSRTDTVQKQITVGNKYFNLGNDTAICVRDTLFLNATTTGAISYTWSIGATTPTIKVSQPGIYWCDVSFNGCIYRDSLVLSNKPYPNVDLGNPATLCEGQTLLLDATNINSTYLWQDGNTNPSYLVMQQGKYFVTVNKQGCIIKDTVDIAYQLKPRFTLGTDKSVCLGTPYILNPGLNGVTYLWQDGSVTPTYRVIQPGNYSVTITNNCGSTTDDIVISTAVCELYVPNSFTPNGDGINDLFKASYGDNVREFHLQVFNRYGQVVFETIDKNKGWDGTYKGVKQPIESYVWLVQYRTNINKNVGNLQGTVLLLQ